jgi:hypothetical protein
MTLPTHLTRDGIGDAGLEWAQSKQFLDTDGDGRHIPPGFVTFAVASGRISAELSASR